MRISGLLVAAASAALLAGCGIGAPTYPQFGDAAYRIEGNTASPDGGAATHTVIYRDGPRMRVEAALPQYGAATIVFDESTNAAYVLNPTGAAPAAVQPTAAPGAPVAPAQPASPNAASGTPVTGRVDTAVAPGTVAAAPPPATGVAVRIADADAPQPLETAWAALGGENARSTGDCEIAGEEGHEWQPREAPAGVQRTACITDDGIVLRVAEEDRVIWEATSVQRGQQDAALFGIPPGYQVINPTEVAEQVGDTMEQLDSVRGSSAQPPTAAPPG